MPPMCTARGLTVDQQSKDDELARKRELAEAMGAVIGEDYRILLGITESTERAHRKRGTAPRYAIVGNTVLYFKDGLRARLEERARGGRRVVAKDAL